MRRARGREGQDDGSLGGRPERRPAGHCGAIADQSRISGPLALICGVVGTAGSSSVYAWKGRPSLSLTPARPLPLSLPHAVMRLRMVVLT